MAHLTLPFLHDSRAANNNFMSFSEFNGFKKLDSVLFELDPNQNVSIDEILQNLSSIVFIRLSA